MKTAFVFALLITVTCWICEIPINNRQRLEMMVNLTKQVQDTFREYNIDTWITQGTLLGSVRNKTVLPWTGDMDINIFYQDLAPLMNSTNKIIQKFNSIGIIFYEMSPGFMKVCYKDVSGNDFKDFQDKHIAPEARLELYGAKKLDNGLYTIAHTACVWNFTGLYPLKDYYIGYNTYVKGPSYYKYWLEQYYGKNWMTPVIYAGDKDLDNICVGEYPDTL